MTVNAPPRERSADWLESLYRSTAADLYAYVASVLHDSAAAEDVVALAFERALRRRLLFNPRRGTARAWLFGIARNAALDELRRQKRTAALVVEPAAEAPQAPEPDERRLAVRAALAQLTPRERELIVLKFHAQCSNGELARLIGTSESNAGTRLHRVLELLRRACDESA